MFGRYVWPVVLFFVLASGCGGGGGSSSKPSSNTDMSAPAQPSQSTPQVDPLVPDFSEYDSLPDDDPSNEPTPPTPAGLSDIQQYYSLHIESGVVQERCVQCHSDVGISSGTDIVFIEGEGADRFNETVFDDFVNGRQFGKEKILNKVRGAESHGGGAILSSSSESFQRLTVYLEQIELQEDSIIDDFVVPSPGDDMLKSFSQITKLNELETLRRASIMIAGRLPTESEKLEALESEDGLRRTIKGLMQGESFHEFIIRGANDVLLTDAFFHGKFFENLNPFSPYYPNVSNARYDAYNGGDRAEFEYWNRYVNYGVIRAPLELIAYVVENDRPYTEILTADYTMVNPQSNRALNGGASFSSEDFRQFKPGKNRGQIIQDDSYSDIYSNVTGLKVTSHSGFVDYPHAGILNELAFLNRYPSSDTNRNRARAKTVYQYFLGIDIEKSAARTTDPDALADTNNPTMNNEACTVCHRMMDPIAGAFQNYGNEGWYRSSWGGMDALPDSYKWAEKNSLYRDGDLWFRDMLPPGFGDDVITNQDNSLQQLARAITLDSRFAEATVKFWWRTLMGSDVLEAPEDSRDEGFQQTLNAYEIQQAFISQLGKDFASGINGGKPYNLRDLLTELVLSDWYRAKAIDSAEDNLDDISLDMLGARRLLKPLELENKTRAILGFAWGENQSNWEFAGRWSMLNDRYRTVYGGIDSVGIVERATSLNTLMSNVAMSQAIDMACPTVVLDYGRDEDARKLFRDADFSMTPTTLAINTFAVEASGYHQSQTYELSAVLSEGEARLNVAFRDPYWDQAAADNALLIIEELTVVDSENNVVFSTPGTELRNAAGFEHSSENGFTSSGNYWDPEMDRETGYVLWRGHFNLYLNIAREDNYTVRVKAYRMQSSKSAIHMDLSLHSPDGDGNTLGEQKLRQQLKSLHELLLGENVSVDSWEINNAYALLVELWESRREDNVRLEAVEWDYETCNIPPHIYQELDVQLAYQDPHYMKGTWISMLIYFMTDYNYLHE